MAGYVIIDTDRKTGTKEMRRKMSNIVDYQIFAQEMAAEGYSLAEIMMELRSFGEDAKVSVSSKERKFMQAKA